MSAIQMRINEDEIEVSFIFKGEPEYIVAKIEDNGNGMEASISESDQLRLGPCELIALAQFLLEKASERARFLECQ
jgi:hypothetical protein